MKTFQQLKKNCKREMSGIPETHLAVLGNCAQQIACNCCAGHGDGSYLGARACIPACVSVAPGKSYTFTFMNIVPTFPGAKLAFTMLQEGITYFGDHEPANTEIMQ